MTSRREPAGGVTHSGDLVASCAFCRWTATHQAIHALPEDLTREIVESVAFLRARLIEHVEAEHPELRTRYPS